MTRIRAECALLAATCALSSVPARAGQPYFTDDARVVTHRSCQLEAGQRVFRGSRENWLLPGCNFTGNLELSLGRIEKIDLGGARDPGLAVQAKGLLRELKADDYGYAWVLSAQRRHDRAPGQESVPEYRGAFAVSRAFGDETFVLHANLGALRDRDQRATAATWAVAGEWNVTDRAALIAEAYDSSRSRRAWQAGLWVALVPDRVELNVSVGGEARDFNATRYWSVGLRFVTPAFLP